jgi:hypothetical protein
LSERLVDRVNFAKIVTVLAVVFGVSLGMCGVTAALSSKIGRAESILIPLGVAELITMGLSAVGLLLTVIVWVIASIFKGRGPQ